jgi:hypothetical protein
VRRAAAAASGPPSPVAQCASGPRPAERAGRRGGSSAGTSAACSPSRTRTPSPADHPRLPLEGRAAAADEGAGRLSPLAYLRGSSRPVAFVCSPPPSPTGRRVSLDGDAAVWPSPQMRPVSLRQTPAVLAAAMSLPAGAIASAATMPSTASLCASPGRAQRSERPATAAAAASAAPAANAAAAAASTQCSPADVSGRAPRADRPAAALAASPASRSPAAPAGGLALRPLPWVRRGEAADWWASGPGRTLGRPAGSGEDAGTPHARRAAAAVDGAPPPPQLAGSL